MKKYVCLFVVFFVVGAITGCASSSIDLSKISIGMSKTEVLSVMGKPSRSSAIEGREFVWFFDGWAGDQYIELIDGKVSGYGSWEDYRNPRKRKPFKIEIDQNIKIEKKKIK